RDEYAKIKKVLAQKFPYDIDGYCDGKEEFVRKIEKLALSQFDGTWDKMYLAARNVQKKREISPLVEAGGVSAAILTEKGNIYVGVCIDTACSLGMCAERNAIANMITNGENGICRLIAVDRNGKAIPPCGACREFMVQLMPDHYHSIQIMMDYENKKMVTLGDITPNWWI
ncbi:GrpB family protein, partial [Sellimonas intestinalis]